MTFEEWWNETSRGHGRTDYETCWAESRKELLELIDGAMPIVELWNSAESPAQKKWQKDWIKKAREILK